MNKPISKFQIAVMDFDLVGYLDRCGYRAITTGNNQLTMNCPFCGAFNKFYVGAVNKLFICFKCEERGNLVKLVCTLSNCDVKSAIKIVYGKVGTFRFNKTNSNALNYHKPIPSDEEWIIEPDYHWAPLIAQCHEDSAVRYYLKERKITDEMAEMFCLRYSPELLRLVFPVNLESGVDCGWVARDITNCHMLKYLNNPGLKKSKVLYGANLHWDKNAITIVEGPVDAIKGHGVGSVALLGKSMSVEQRNILLSFPNLSRVYVGIDPDQPGSAQQVAEIMLPFYEVFIVNFDSYRDFGDRTPDEIGNLITNSSKVKSKFHSFPSL